MTQERGQLWWVADNMKELGEHISQYVGKGAVLISITPSEYTDAIHYVIELEKQRALEILGYIPDEEEWLIQ